MQLFDKNQTLEPPEGFTLDAVYAEGEYLVATYRRVNCVHDGGGSYLTVVIYLNEMGREVVRTTDVTEWKTLPRLVDPLPVGRWYRFKAGFYLALAGAEEMLKCLSK